MVVHVFHENENLSDLFFWEKNKQSAKSQQRSIGLKEKALPKFQMKTILIKISVGENSEKKNKLCKFSKNEKKTTQWRKEIVVRVVSDFIPNFSEWIFLVSKNKSIHFYRANFTWYYSDCF